LNHYLWNTVKQKYIRYC